MVLNPEKHYLFPLIGPKNYLIIHSIVIYLLLITEKIPPFWKY